MNNINGISGQNYSAPAAKETPAREAVCEERAQVPEDSAELSVKSLPMYDNKEGGVLFNKRTSSCASSLENGTNKLIRQLLKPVEGGKPLSRKTVKNISAVPSGFTRSVGDVLDSSVKNMKNVAENTKVRFAKTSEILQDESLSSMQCALSVAGSVVGGAVGTAMDLTASYLDMKSSVGGIVKRTVFNAVDNFEGTKTKTLKKEDSIAAGVDTRTKELTESLKQGHCVAVGVTLGLGAAIGGALAETVSEVLDMGKLISARMDERAQAKGQDYGAMRAEIREEYEASDKGVLDRLKMTGERAFLETKRVVTNLRIGDALRGADAIQKMPKRMAINTARNVGDVFK